MKSISGNECQEVTGGLLGALVISVLIAVEIHNMYLQDKNDKLRQQLAHCEGRQEALKSVGQFCGIE